jgi:HAD superfamily hydrolase (TIGR01509 family)
VTSRLLPEAVLWDLDGTLVDTEPAWMAAEHEMTTAHGVEWTHADALALIGSDLVVAAQLFQSRGVAWSVPEILDFMITRVAKYMADAVPWHTGARELLAALDAARVPCALVTMSYRVLAEAVVAGAPSGVFHTVVTGDSVTYGKPHPEAYLTAAEQLGVDPSRCVAIEDSLNGLASAEAAGARVIGVQRLLPIPTSPGRSRIGTLVGLTVDDLARVSRGEVIDRLGA